MKPTPSTQVFLDELVYSARIPGIACAMSSGHGDGMYWYAGRHSWNEGARNVSRETVFDLASLTKVLTTHQWCLTLVSDGRLDLNAPISTYLRGVSPWLAQCPVWRLSNHTSGLPAHVEFFNDRGAHVLEHENFAGEYLGVIDRIKSQSPAYSTGTDQRYSDLGYILLAHICEIVDEPIQSAFTKLYGHGGDFNQVHWRPSRTKTVSPDAEMYAATERCPWRQKLIQGEVHDDNCWTMGGLAGHAGAFGTLEAVHHLSVTWLNALTHRKTHWL